MFLQHLPQFLKIKSHVTAKTGILGQNHGLFHIPGNLFQRHPRMPRPELVVVPKLNRAFEHQRSPMYRHIFQHRDQHDTKRDNPQRNPQKQYSLPFFHRMFKGIKNRGIPYK